MASPTATLTNNAATTGEIEVTWTDAGQAGSWFAYRLYVRTAGSVDWVMVTEITTDASSFSYDLYAFAANATTEVAVVEVTNSTGGFAEGAYNVVSTTTSGITGYYLVHPTDHSKSFYLNHVTADTIRDVDEVGSFTLIGRGRKIDRGTNIGIEGTLNATLYPTTGRTVRQQWNELRALREPGCGAVLIRTPFGDVTKAVITATDRARVAAGTQDYMTVTITYLEAA